MVRHRPGMDLSGVTRQVTLPVRPDPLGRAGPTPDQVRGNGWRRSARGFYVPAGVDGNDPDQRVVEAAAVLPEDWGGVTGWADLGWRGGRWFDGTPWGGGPVRPVVLAVGGNRAIRPQPAYGILTTEERLAPHDHELVDGLRVTTAVRSVCFEMRCARDVWDAVTFIDMACFNDLVSIDEVAEYADFLNGWTGVPQCREAIPLASENAWSPREVGMRKVWVRDGRRPPPLCNVPIFGLDGRRLGTPDLFDPELGVVGEYDGGVHFVDGRRRPRDLDREEMFRSLGLEVVHMLADDVRDPTRFERRLEAAYLRAQARPAGPRLWTLDPPPGWHDTTTVAARRALDDFWRSRLLAHRAA
jgi:hypothetical protein